VGSRKRTISALARTFKERLEGNPRFYVTFSPPKHCIIQEKINNIKTAK
jgi:hypothetical protein